MGNSRGVHQFVVGASPGDAIYDQALLIQRGLQDWGYRSNIYACHMHPSLANRVPHFTQYRSQPADVAIFHYSIGSDLSEFVRQLRIPVVMIYHNVTPAVYLDTVSHEMAELVRRGQAELPGFRTQVRLALADSEFNRQDLIHAGYTSTGLLPIVLDESRYAVSPDNALLEQYRGSTNLLFVGRIAPNKRQEEVLKIFYYYHQIQPNSHLFFVGQAWDPARRYLSWLHSMVDHLGLTGVVSFTGHVSFEEMVTYYHLADLFLGMSDHEGFCKPLIESMYFDVPIVAYASTAVPYTLGEAGVLVHTRDHALLAELVDVILTDDEIRHQIIATQRRRFDAFREVAMLRQLRTYLSEVLTDG